ncbi:Ldh family oxidoreductase [Streptomyces dysideae]|uniref:Lactate dehydrogenase n=1 Tax=Streptomyces dysideae TaxID=909626 RepID=A0A101UUU2_9ACTN|nr:Ldh family oxidoreductase [Streptomyces dysideae]KUO17262.1 lactate dehydrogenase [Streptomyces dysideae]
MIGTSETTEVRVPYEQLLDLATAAFVARGLPRTRASQASEALCHGDLVGAGSHGTVNLTRLYLPLLEEGRADPAGSPVVLADHGGAVLVDARRTLGLWQAGDAMDLAIERAARFGVGLVSVRNGTHFGCAGHHARRAAEQGMVGLVASNCGRQRIARPPGGAVALLGTNPLSVAAPAGEHPPFVLDMSTTAAPTGRVRAAARIGHQIPPGWLADDGGRAVTDPSAFDRGEAHLLWLGATSSAFKGFGLGLMVEVLSALVAGSGFGPAAEALTGDGRPSGRDDDIGMLMVAIAPALLRGPEAVAQDAEQLFGTVLACPPVDRNAPVRYPGWPEAERARHHRRHGVPLEPEVHHELAELAATLGTPFPADRGER